MRSLDFLPFRHRRFLAPTAAVLALLATAGVFLYLTGLRTEQRARAAALSQDLTRMELMAQSIRSKGGHGPDFATALAGRAPGFSLFSHLDHAIEVAGVKDKVAAVTPAGQQETTGGLVRRDLTVVLEAATLEEGLGLIEAVESPELLVVVRRIELRRPRPEQQFLDIRIDVSTIDQKKQDH